MLERAWLPGDVVELNLDMQPDLVEPHARIDAVRASVAIQHGPLVYCLEGIDQPNLNLLDLQLDSVAPLQAAWQADLLPEGMMVVRGQPGMCRATTMGQGLCTGPSIAGKTYRPGGPST